MLIMIRRLMRSVGFALMSYGTIFTPIIAAADSDSAVTYAVIGFPSGALITGFILVSMSRTKFKATKADKYKKGALTLHDQKDIFIRTETNKVKVSND